MTSRTPEQIALAVQALAHIEAHPDDWEQTTWRCETGMCFAGWTATLAGREWLYDAEHCWSSMLAPLPGESDDVYVLDDGTRSISVEAVATSLLGLDEDEADALFMGDNEIETLRRYVANIVAGRPLDS